MRIFLTAKRLWNGATTLDDPEITIEDGRIASIVSRLPGSGTVAKQPARLPDGVLDYPDSTLAPAFFDVHIHGAAGHDVMEATPKALNTIGRFLASRGTASFLATTVTAPLDLTLRALEALARLIESPQSIESSGDNSHPIARPIGIHLEGPFLSHEKCGVQPREHMLAPNITTFDRFFEAAQGRVRLMTLGARVARRSRINRTRRRARRPRLGWPFQRNCRANTRRD